MNSYNERTLVFSGAGQPQEEVTCSLEYTRRVTQSQSSMIQQVSEAHKVQVARSYIVSTRLVPTTIQLDILIKLKQSI